MGFIAIAGGVALTLFGIRFLRKGLDRLFGGAIYRWLSQLGRSPLRAFGGGVIAGLVAPSSTGLAVLGAQLLGRETGGLAPRAVLAMLLGAGVGLTVTVQLLSFHADHFAEVLLVIGVAGFQFCRREVLRGVGQCLLALGLVFFAMRMIGEGAQLLTAQEEIREILVRLQGHRWLVALAACGLSVLLQSSTATIALGLALATAGLFGAEALVPWVLGTNVGLGATSLLVGWSQLDSRRLGLGNIVAKLLVALPLLLLPAAGLGWFGALPGSLVRQTALWHTLFNLAVGVIALPLLPPLWRLVELLAPETGLKVNERFLDPRMLDTPAIALAQATRETLRMADRVRLMLDNFWPAFVRQDADLARQIRQQDDVLDRMNTELKDYLSQIGGNRNPADTNWQFSLLAFSAELEAVGDLVDKHLCDGVLKQRAERVTIIGADREDLEEAYRRVLRSLDTAASLLTTRHAAAAETLVAGKQEFNEWSRSRLRRHYESLSQASREQLAGSAYFVDALNALRRINSHLSTIGYSFR